MQFNPFSNKHTNEVIFLENQIITLIPLLLSVTMIMSLSEAFGHCFRFKTRR